ncbi:hypothetical protein K438DRAFT_1823114 [Mycena galopus ATCC 62051]|nr:hypothetical protein K438DRAFT_1823114 [Mycena galopus ATCC 62051]
MSSPFASRLGTNYCPGDAELAQIRALLVEPCLKLKRLDDEIVAMQKALDKLAEERGALSAYVDAHRTLMSPARRLPLDIIEEIFVACLPTNRNCVMSAQEAPLMRAISLGTPRLWSRLHIVEPTFDDRMPPPLWLLEVNRVQRLEAAEAWLQRSGTCPLSISLESCFNPGGAATSFTPWSTSPFLNSLISFASRWQNVSLAIPLLAVQTLLCLTENDVPLLKSLAINQHPESPHHDAQWSMSCPPVGLAPSVE